MASLEDTLASKPEDLLVPTKALVRSSLDAVKASLDPVAKEYSIFEAVHVDGLDAEQVWAQTQMIVDGAIDKLMGEVFPQMSKKRGAESMSEDEDEGVSDEDSEGWDVDEEASGMVDDEAEEATGESDESEGEGLEESDVGSIDEGVDDYEESDLEEEEETPEPKQGRGEADADSDDDDDGVEKHELDDEIFRLKEFQKQVLDLEKEPEDDGEDIDYFNVVGPESDEDPESDDDMRYEDFFDAPSKGRSKGKSQQKTSIKRKGQDEDDDEADWQGLGSDDEGLEEAMSSAKKDLFDDEDLDDDEDDGTGENLSTFERQQRELMKQIRELEAENVAQKEWAVRGEVAAKERPQDSLVTTELDFERNSKPVPVITQDVTDTLEDMIRQRIKNRDFDDLPRRLPDSLPQYKPSKLADVSETKSQKSLAELYEDDYARANDASYRDASDDKTAAAHREIEELYGALSRKLDALCSWNYTPKTPKPAVNVVVNAPAISMEEAQPTAMASTTQLAPHEVYKPESSSRREVTGADGLPVAKAEMTREERKRERRRHKAKRAKLEHEREERERSKAAKKQGSAADVMQTLKKSGNVTVIGKKGEKRDLKGNIKTDAKKKAGADLKL